MRVRAPSKRWWHHPRPNKRFKRLHTALAVADHRTDTGAPKALRATLSELGFERQALHAETLGFLHPISGEYVEFQAEMPMDMRELIDQIAR